MYVPILKWKAGERIAIRNLPDEIKNSLRPVLMVMSGGDPEGFLNEVTREWGGSRPFYVDFHPRFEDEPGAFLEELKSADLAIIPVISLIRDSEYLKTIEDNAKSFNLGIAIRLTLQDFDEAESILADLLRYFSVANDDIDLIIDCEQISLPTEVIKSLASVISTVLSTAAPFRFRHTIVAGSSFPESLNVRQGQISILPRKEWALWNEIIKKFPNAEFGDYGADDPNDLVIDQPVTIIPTIRYTRDDSWYIVRGTYDPRAPFDFSQYHGLSQKLITQPMYCGKDYSWGDLKIFECAKKPCSGTKCNHGNLLTWVEISVNHHLTYVANQLSSFVSP